MTDTILPRSLLCLLPQLYQYFITHSLLYILVQCDIKAEPYPPDSEKGTLIVIVLGLAEYSISFKLLMKLSSSLRCLPTATCTIGIADAAQMPHWLGVVEF